MGIKYDIKHHRLACNGYLVNVGPLFIVELVLNGGGEIPGRGNRMKFLVLLEYRLWWYVLMRLWNKCENQLMEHFEYDPKAFSFYFKKGKESIKQN